MRTRSAIANRQAVTGETSRPADAARTDLELRVTEMKKERNRLDVTAGSGGVESLELEGSSGSVSERISGPGDVIRQNLLKTKQEQSRLDVTARSGGVESLELEGSSGSVSERISGPGDVVRQDLLKRKKERSRLNVTAGSGGVESLELEGSSGSVTERISGPGDVIRQNLLKTKQEQSRLDVTARSGGVESLELEGSSGSVSERISGPGSVEGLELSQASSSVAELTGDEHFRLLYPFHEWWWPDPPKGFIDSNAYLFLSRMPLLSPSEAVKTYESSDRDLYSMYR